MTTAALDLNGWVTLTNESGVSYPDAHLQLVAGDVHRVEEAYGVRGAVLGKMVAAAAAPEMRRSPCLSTILHFRPAPPPSPTTRRSRWPCCRPTALLAARSTCSSMTVGRTAAGSGDGGRRVPVGVWVEVANDQGSGLGRPPARRDCAGVQEAMPAAGSSSSVRTGWPTPRRTRSSACARRCLRCHRGAAADRVPPPRYHQGRTETKRERLGHHREERPRGSGDVRVRETLPGDWQILQESVAHTKASAHAAVQGGSGAGPGSLAELTYRVRVRP